MKILTFSILFFISLSSFCQGEEVNFINPMDIPMLLSGNFGELRNNHFHTGLDIKTQGRTGIPIRSIEEGFVSRIKVSVSGYGNALYIEHPNGYTSVYAHLDSFNDSITNFLREAQYNLEEHCVYLYPGPDELKVEQGDFIGLSGNTGSSGGPHLHFEIRETATEYPINPQSMGIVLSDTKSPKIQGIMMLPIADNSTINGENQREVLYCDKNSGVCSLKSSSSIKAGGKIGLAIKTDDQYSGSSNSCGIYSIKLYMDDELIYHQVMDDLDFETFRYINSHMVYDYYKENKSRFQRNYLLPNNDLNIYEVVKNNGIFELEAGKNYRFKYLVEDYNGNQSTLNFEVVGDDPKVVEEKEISEDCHLFRFDEDSNYQSEHVMVYIPKKRLYENECLEIQEMEIESNMVSSTFKIGSSKTPIQNEILIKIKTDSLVNDKSQTTAILRRDKGKRLISLGGEWSQGWFEFRTKEFGYFSLMQDANDPVISPRSFTQNMKGKKSMSFRITDDLSGIVDYDIYIDDQWVLGEYNPNNESLTYLFDSKRLEHGNHEILVTLVDAVGNQSKFEGTFDW